ncbi:MAG: O-methyltransferase [Lachnospiraceae bacterium]|nr:O-methyltransferase [Lachnospiraceae bacterium]MDE7185645.1 O-methyltransferase [Lachnospiraceae bacterium]
MDERMLTFIHSFDSEKPAYLGALERYARETNVPIIRPQMQSLLRFLVTWGRPMRILEVGTAIGFSALLMSEYAPEGCHITTIEKYEKRIPLAKENFEKAGKSDCITLLEGEASEILASLKADGAFDLIFMDAAKGQYINFLPDIRRLLSPTGLLVSDNILQDGELIESKYAVIRRNRTIHNRMRAYLYELTHCEELETTILPIADGVTLSAKRGARTEK